MLLIVKQALYQPSSYFPYFTQKTVKKSLTKCQKTCHLPHRLQLVHKEFQWKRETNGKEATFINGFAASKNQT
jgi:hypothetical protein